MAFPKEVEVDGTRLKQLSETEWDGVQPTGKNLDFHIVDEGEDTDFPERFTLILFDAAVEDADEAYVDNFGVESLEEAVREALAYDPAGPRINPNPQ